MKRTRVIASLILLIFTLLVNSVNCQVLFSGKIIDAESKESLPYVSIVVPSNKLMGTISNINGAYSLGGLNIHDTVNFSFVGYKTKNIEVSNSNMSNMTIELKSEEHILNEVTVLSFTSKSLIQSAFDRIKDNYPSKYLILDGIYRKQISVNNKPVFLGDCKMKIKAPVYKQKRNKKFPRCIIIDKRISEALTKVKINFTLDANTTIFLYPDYTYPRLKLKNSIQTKISKQFITEEGEIVYKVVFEDKDVNKVTVDKGCFYVTAKEKAIIAVHRKQRLNDMKVKTKTLINMYFVFDAFYKKSGKKYLFDYGRAHWSFDLQDEKDNNNNINKYDVVVDYLVKDRDVKKGKGRFRSIKKDPFAKLNDAAIVPLSNFKEILPDYK